MGSETKAIPFIDFSSSELKRGTPEWNSLKAQVMHAVEEHGYFLASYDKIPKQLRNDAFHWTQKICDLPMDTKLSCSTEKTKIGYMGKTNYPTVHPVHEAYGIYNSDIPEEIEKFTKIIYPQGNQEFSGTILSFSQKLSELDKTIRTMVLEALGVEKYIDEFLQSNDYASFLSRYGARKPDDDVTVMKAHKDQPILNLLAADSPGLQMWTKDEQWVDITTSANSYVVFVGEAFHAWTNGRLKAPLHRVHISGDQPRISVGMFSNPKSGTLVKAPEELIDEKHPMLYKPYDQADYDNFIYSNLEETPDLKNFCGV